MKTLTDFKPYEVMYIDGMNLLSRSHHAMSGFEYKGKRTGMLYGVVRLVLDWYKKSPDIKIVFIWEGANSWRRKKYPIYKSNRNPDSYKDSDIFWGCVETVKQALPSMGVMQVWSDTNEADDVVATLVFDEIRKVVMVSNDWDWWPLYPFGDILYGNNILNQSDMASMFTHKYGDPSLNDFSRLRFFKVLTGDSSDGVSGIPRFPKKLAVELCNDPECDETNIVDYLANNNNLALSQRVVRNEWLITRNTELIYPANVTEIKSVDPRYSLDEFLNICIENGMESLYDKLKGLNQ